MKEFKLILMASNRLFYNGPCVSLTVPTPDGQWGILANHAPMVTALTPGELCYSPSQGTTESVAVGEGFVQVNERDVLVLAETMERPEEIDENQLRRALEDAQEAIRQRRGQQEYRIARAELASALGKLKVKDHQRR